MPTMDYFNDLYKSSEQKVNFSNVKSTKVCKAEANEGWQDKMESSLACHKYMFDHQLACDVYFDVPTQVGGTERTRIGAHVYMLAARSSVFLEMLSNNRCREIVVEDVDSETFQKIIRFLYSAEASINERNVASILIAVKKYKICDLEEMCIQFLMKGINAANVLFRMGVALQCTATDLLRSCETYVKRNLKMLMEIPEFLTLDNKVLSKIVENDELVISEIELFEGVLKWAKKQCSSSQVSETSGNLRETIGDMIFKLRFPTMKMEDFTATVVPIGILSQEEIVELFKVFTSVPGARENMKLFPVDDRQRTGTFKSEDFTCDVFDDFQITTITTCQDINQNMSTTLFFKIDNPLTIKSLTFLFPIQAPYASNLHGVLTINQGSPPAVLNTTINIPVDTSKQAVQFTGQSFSLGTYAQPLNLKEGDVLITLEYCWHSPEIISSETSGLTGKRRILNECNELRFFIAQPGPIYSVEFSK